MDARSRAATRNQLRGAADVPCFRRHHAHHLRRAQAVPSGAVPQTRHRDDPGRLAQAPSEHLLRCADSVPTHRRRRPGSRPVAGECPLVHLRCDGAARGDPRAVGIGVQWAAGRGLRAHRGIPGGARQPVLPDQGVRDDRCPVPVDPDEGRRGGRSVARGRCR
ncbi:hypothetical protein SDC9_204039 [bioreactor metagenome]|uniref:Uncharacterized protein n=1 Tax=bioreactor metagenome TaxID=1076179 RepID=A0A645IYE1_9ZZZZ